MWSRAIEEGRALEGCRANKEEDDDDEQEQQEQN